VWLVENLVYIEYTMAITVEEAVLVGLNMLAVARGRLVTTWEHYEKQKLMKVELKSGRIFTVYTSFSHREKELSTEIARKTRC
jgi:hypothetical protein